jgi:hypothetical protein
MHNIIGKVKENFNKNKKIWIMAIVAIILILLVIILGQTKIIDKVQEQLEPCPPGELYNKVTGEFCPEDPEPPFDPALLENLPG